MMGRFRAAVEDPESRELPLRQQGPRSPWCTDTMMTSARVPAALINLLLLLLLLSSTPSTAQPGFLNLDCGGTTGDYTDGIGIHWTSDSRFISGGQIATLSPRTEQLQKQYRSLRYFPVDNRKYCYSIDVRERARYLVRASFLYDSFDESPIYPKFRISLGAAQWSTVVISDPGSVEVEEAVVLTQTSKLSVCLSDAATGHPFISTLELRMFTGSLYATPYESEFFLGLSARVNFGAESNDSIRYPDDPFDRIWKSDLVEPLGMASGTRRVSTSRPVFIGRKEEPPQRVMQTAVVGQKGFLSYEFVFQRPPGNSWANTYYAEVEDLAPTETRNFTVEFSDWPQYRGLTVDVAAEARGSYRLYEATFDNVSIPHLLFMKLKKTNEFSRGPIINAFEVYMYLPITADDRDLATARRRRRTEIIAACTVSGALLLILAAVGCCYYFRCKNNAPPAAAPEEEELALMPFQPGPMRYPPSEIETAMNGFERSIGSGGSANVYYGRLADGTEIAAKRLNTRQQSVGDFTSEITLLSRLHHRNVVSLLGYSQQGEDNILVYEFMHNGTVKQHLPGGAGLQITSWAQRLQIAAGAARGMECLHTGCTPAILHRDLKTSNILLDCNMRAKIANFGMSEQMARAQMQNGNAEAITDGSFDAGYKPRSVQMVADLAFRCVRTQAERPSSSEVVREIEDAVRVELRVEAAQEMPPTNTDLDDSEYMDLVQVFSEMIHRPSHRA